MDSKSLGCLLGAAVGDAAGGVLEFMPRVTQTYVDHALTMPGGGCWMLRTGQITDDTELALALARGLRGADPLDAYPADAVAAEYHRWYLSDPFDIGGTCAQAFRHPTDEAMRQHANGRSQANGALMRIAPLVVWARDAPSEVVAAHAMADARLSHPNRACQEASAVFAILAHHMLNVPGDAAGALEAAQTWLRAHATSEVLDWFEPRVADDLDPSQNIGWVKHAFVLALGHLRWGSSFEDALRHTLMQAGDTDTNAAIVCCLMGAVHGLEGIPGHLVNAVVECAPTDRPSHYWPRDFLTLSL